MLDVLFLSRLIPKEIDADVRGNMINFMNDAAIAWQEHIIFGLDANLEKPVKLLNLLPIASYPLHYKEPFIKQSEFSHANGAEDINVGFCNVRYIKRLIQGGNLYREVTKWANADNRGKKVIITYTLYPEFMEAVRRAKNINSDIIANAIVLDLPEYTILLKKVSLVSKMYLYWSKKKAANRMKYFDCYTLLTRQMANALELSQPFIVVEGICSEEFPLIEERVDDKKTVFYAGILHERFGVLKLVEAFRQIEDKNYCLVICGLGDSQDEIRDVAKHDSRVEFLGQLPRTEVLKHMVSVSVIVNPRGNTEEFVKYSFPSKNIEGLSSGIPFIGFKLAGIPDEYDEFINYPEEETVDSLAKKIREVCDDVDGTYAKKAASAKKWVIENKNPKIQAEKILDLINGVTDEDSD